MDGALALELNVSNAASGRSQVAERLLGSSAAMRAAREMVARVAPTETTLLLRGETGTGKDLLARAIHAQSKRHAGPFVVCPLAALPDTLIESELFGYEKGAFTGAAARKPGYVERARGGTLLLDEIGDVSLPMQVKLLRLLQEREYTPLGGLSALPTDVRFLAATHRDLESMIQAGEFRQDLFYRLNVVALELAPLRERSADIPHLVRARAEQLCAELGRTLIEFDDGALQRLCEESWPGNVRELLSFVERLVVLAAEATITAEDVQHARSTRRQPVAACEGLPEVTPDAAPVRTLAEELRRAERDALRRALAVAAGNKSLAARWLEISRTSLYQKLDLHGLGAPAAVPVKAGALHLAG